MKVLIPIEDASSQTDVLQFLVSHKWPDRVTFRLIHVIELPRPVDVRPPYWEDAMDKMVSRTKSLVGEFASALKKQIPSAEIKVSVVDGVPKYAILEMAKKEAVDMIVMGSHGRKGLSRVLSGSVAEAVCVGAACPVTIIKSAPLPEPSCDMIYVTP